MSTDDTQLLKRVLAELAELRAIMKPVGAPKLDLSREEVMHQLGFEPGQVKQFYQVAWRIKLKPYRQRHYRACDVEEAVARAAFRKMKPTKKPLRKAA